jgi:four helix bundle protein
MKSYRELIAWQEAMNLIELVYNITNCFPKVELYSLTNQMRRAAVSIASNIAEGYGRSYRKEYLHHISIAKGSLFEIETHILISKRLKFISEEDFILLWNQSQKVGKLLTGLQKSLKI